MKLRNLGNIIPESVNYINNFYTKNVDTVLILGTGLGEMTSIISNTTILPYESIPHFPTTTSPSHKGKLILGELKDKNIAIMKGRPHFYEGYNPLELVYPLFVLSSLKAKNIILTNAAGSLNRDLKVGDLVLIKDHINLTGKNPLIGENNPDFGPRFPSMHNAYNKNYIKLILKISKDNKQEIKTGIYAGLTGPSLETKAECKMLKNLGADMVGMSTVLEVITGVYLNLKISAISIITNLSNLFHDNVHIQSNIIKTANMVQNKLIVILKKFILLI